jgi:hypothetical protein
MIKFSPKIKIEPTVPQKNEPFFTQHEISKHRTALFQKMRTAAGNQAPDIRQPLTIGTLVRTRRLHQDNGR